MQPTCEQITKRLAEIPDQINYLCLNNNVLHLIKQHYISGGIITKEEMYCQMIVQLAHDWKKDYDDYVKLVAMQPPIKLFNKY